MLPGENERFTTSLNKYPKSILQKTQQAIPRCGSVEKSHVFEALALWKSRMHMNRVATYLSSCSHSMNATKNCEWKGAAMTNPEMNEVGRKQKNGRKTAEKWIFSFQAWPVSGLNPKKLLVWKTFYGLGSRPGKDGDGVSAHIHHAHHGLAGVVLKSSRTRPHYDLIIFRSNHAKSNSNAVDELSSIRPKNTQARHLQPPQKTHNSQQKITKNRNPPHHHCSPSCWRWGLGYVRSSSEASTYSWRIHPGMLRCPAMHEEHRSNHWPMELVKN